MVKEEKQGQTASLTTTVLALLFSPSFSSYQREGLDRAKKRARKNDNLIFCSESYSKHASEERVQLLRLNCRPMHCMISSF